MVSTSLINYVAPGKKTKKNMSLNDTFLVFTQSHISESFKFFSPNFLYLSTIIVATGLQTIQFLFNLNWPHSYLYLYNKLSSLLKYSNIKLTFVSVFYEQIVFSLVVSVCMWSDLRIF
jgi:hypothetical protein